MRAHGTLVKWNEDRGFGFVLVASGAEEVFVHISAFPRDGKRPQAGETISFEIQTGADGRRLALRVQRPTGVARRAGPDRQNDRDGRGKSPFKDRKHGRVAATLSLLAIVAIGAYVLHGLGPVATTTAVPLAPSTLAQPLSAGESFTCDGRKHCAQMRSCAEAEYFLKHCPGTQMDGDGDGEPCEQQLCN